MKILDRVWLGLSALLVLMTVASCICVASVFVNPEGVFTFLAGPTAPLPVLLSTPPPFLSPTPVITFPTMPPEWTATTAPEASPTRRQGIAPEATASPTPDADSSPTAFPSPIGPTATDTEVTLPTRTATVRVPTPTRTATPGSYPGQEPTATQAGYP
jgi:hypothetical protein